MMKRILFLGLLVLALTSCGGSGNATIAVNSGTLRVVITDAPAVDFAQINVTISGLRVHTSADAGTGDAGWHDLTLTEPVRVDLLSLQDGFFWELGQLPLEAGHYQQVRLLLASNSTESPLNNSVVPASGPDAGVELPLDTRPEDRNGIKIVHQFIVSEGMTADLVLDFDGKNSVVVNGNGTCSLQPVITASVTRQQVR
ncbi:MAG: DUF4382 domain-containing protein [Candidatus Sulfobium sp.]|jgi:hypothetical protein